MTRLMIAEDDLKSGPRSLAPIPAYGSHPGLSRGRSRHSACLFLLRYDSLCLDGMARGFLVSQASPLALLPMLPGQVGRSGDLEVAML